MNYANLAGGLPYLGLSLLSGMPATQYYFNPNTKEEDFPDLWELIMEGTNKNYPMMMGTPSI